jgi:hypothetical protein
LHHRQPAAGLDININNPRTVGKNVAKAGVHVATRGAQ